MNIKALNLARELVVMTAKKEAVTLPFTPTVFGELDARFDGFEGCELIALMSYDASWSTWEMHPNGDEIVILLEGRVSLALEVEGGEEVVELKEPGETVIVPRGVWHTSRTTTPSRLIFVTPGQGTEHRPA